MGDMKAQARGADVPVHPDDVDPFADLADIFESEIGRAAFAASPGPTGSGAAPAFESDFADALAADLAGLTAPTAAAAANSPSQSWIAPRAVRLADPSEDRGTYGTAAFAGGPRSPLALQADLEEALRGLSAPANPRHPIVVETQSFAPDRVVDEPIEDLSAPELDDFDELIASELAVMNGHGEMRSSATARRSAYPAATSLPAGVDYSVAIEDGDPSGAYETGFDDEAEETPRRRRAFLSRSKVALGAGVALMALVGAVGLGLWSEGGASRMTAASGEPPLIKADATPFKTVPTEPGGRSIPNQNKAVYERVASPASAQPAPVQQALLTDAEEPIELPEEDAVASSGPYENLPGVDLADNEGLDLKDEGRIETASAEEAPDPSPIPVLRPRKVRTMVVRPDGTIVQAEMPDLTAVAQAPEPAAADAPPALIEIASNTPLRTGGISDIQAPAPAPAPAPAQAEPPAPVPAAMPAPAAMSEAVPEADVVPTASPAMPDPQSMVPVQIAPPAEVAAVEPPPAAPAATPPTAGGYFVQISSQPSEALARSSLQSLGARYAKVIEGRSVGIQTADIPGKGIFYRVRIAAASKSEASSLCNRLKAAGGNCFVAR